MNPRLYERLYGLRYAIPLLGAAALLVICAGGYLALGNGQKVAPTPVVSVATAPTIGGVAQSSQTPVGTSVGASTGIASPAAAATIVSPAAQPTARATDPIAVPSPTLRPPAVPTPTPIIAPVPVATPIAPPPTPIVPAPAPVASQPTMTSSQLAGDGNYVVQTGDSLWSIASDQCKSGFRWPAIFRANTGQVFDPDLLFVGWALKIRCLP